MSALPPCLGTCAARPASRILGESRGASMSGSTASLSLCLATLVVKVVPLYDSVQLLPSQCPHDLLDITRAGAGDWRMAVGDARPDELCECRSGESGWGCKWGCKDQRAPLSDDFTCLFNQRPRQEASPHNCAVPMATPLLIAAHPLPDAFQQRGEVGNRECWRERRWRRRRICVCVCVLCCLLEEKQGFKL